MIEYLLVKHSYWFYIAMIMVGFYGMMAKNNLMKKLIGMNIFQWSIILYYISIGSKKGGTLPVVIAGQTGPGGGLHKSPAARADAHRHRGGRGHDRHRPGAAGDPLPEIRNAGRRRDHKGD